MMNPECSNPIGEWIGRPKNLKLGEIESIQSDDRYFDVRKFEELNSFFSFITKSNQ